MERGRECGVVWCGVVWCGVVWCGVVWRGVVWCGVVAWMDHTLPVRVLYNLSWLSCAPVAIVSPSGLYLNWLFHRIVSSRQHGTSMAGISEG